MVEPGDTQTRRMSISPGKEIEARSIRVDTELPLIIRLLGLEPSGVRTDSREGAPMFHPLTRMGSVRIGYIPFFGVGC